jgi:hypothetical protein
VVYLRSFDQYSSFASGGSYTVELELAEAVSPIGPMVANGKLYEHMERTATEYKEREG